MQEKNRVSYKGRRQGQGVVPLGCRSEKAERELSLSFPLREARHLIAIGRAMEKIGKRKSTGGQKAKAVGKGATLKEPNVSTKRAVKTSPNKE